jgi:glycosyltransferase involved in cell wall biosynthesis
MVIFPWGVDLNQFTPAQSSPLRLSLGWNDCFVLISTRRWEPLLGVDVLVRGFALAARSASGGSAMRLLLLGRGSQEAQIRSILAEYQIQDQVRFAGFVPEERMPEVFRASDLYVSASHSDGSSVSLMQALACGLPALVSDIPGNREWVEPGCEGWLFPDGNVEALADRILAAFLLSGKLAEMGRAARKRAEARADWAKNFPSLLDAYDMAIRQVALGR